VSYSWLYITAKIPPDKRSRAVKTRSHCARTPVDSLSLAQSSKIGTAILINEEHILTVIATLGNVAAYLGDGNASSSSHAKRHTPIHVGRQ